MPAHVLAAATLLYVEGDVTVLDRQGDWRKQGAQGDALKDGETVVTGPSAKAVIRDDANLMSVLNANTRLRIVEPGIFDHMRGMAYYLLDKIPKGASLADYKVNTSVGVMGIRGTRFLVEAEEQQGAVSLQEGLIKVSAHQGDNFSITEYPANMSFSEFQQAQDELFERFKKNGFEAWKAQQQDAFERFKQGFFIEPDQTVYFDSGTVRYRATIEGHAEMMSKMESLLEAHRHTDAGQPVHPHLENTEGRQESKRSLPETLKKLNPIRRLWPK